MRPLKGEPAKPHEVLAEGYTVLGAPREQRSQGGVPLGTDRLANQPPPPLVLLVVYPQHGTGFGKKAVPGPGRNAMVGVEPGPLGGLVHDAKKGSLDIRSSTGLLRTPFVVP